MKNIKTFKKTSSQVISFVLAIMVFVSSLPYFPLTADAAITNPGVKTTQTGFTNVLEFETAKWSEIIKETFDNATDLTYSNGSVKDVNDLINMLEVKNDGSKYFSWHLFTEDERNSGITAWDGTTITDEDKINSITGSETITYAGDSVPSGDGKTNMDVNKKVTIKTDGTATVTSGEAPITYTVYNVSNASELRYAMEQAQLNQYVQNTKINITNDIDLNGSTYTWEPYIYSNMKSKWFYIEGNGHTIYNMRCHNIKKGANYGSGGFVGYISGGRFIMKNLNFSNCLSFSNEYNCTSVAIGFLSCQAYIENVNICDSFVYSKKELTGTLIGRTDTNVGNIFIRNCSSRNCYIYGRDHSGGLTGCQHNTNNNSTFDYGYKVKYNTAFPSSPEAWLNYGSYVYPEMVEDSYSVDCTVFSNGGDSGAFLSCGGKLICRNCFTNNIMYGNTKTGAFFGRIVTKDGGAYPLYDDNGEKTVDIYFENCYASGSVEGNSKIGGFVGFEDSYDDERYGVSVYKNCYTTSMVGMDYAGSQLGGFIGHESTYPVQKTVIKDENGKQINVDKNGDTKAGSVYINCYAAGEVGNIQTKTSTTSTGNYQGGFLGEVGETNGTYVNCYYDMQTTGMRERAAGKSDQFYVSDFSAIDSAVNSDTVLTDTQKDNLIKLRNDYIYHMESKVDENYNIDLTPIDNALDLITNQQKNALLELKQTIQTKDSSIDISAINDVLGIVNYDGSEKTEKLNALKDQISQVLSDENLNIPDYSIIDIILSKDNLTTYPNSNITISADDMASLKILRDNVQRLVDNKFYPQNVGLTTLKDICGAITSDEVIYLKGFRTTLNSILQNDDNKAKIEDTIANSTDEKLYNKYTLDEMCQALNDVISNVNTYISGDQNSKLIALREVLIDCEFWTDKIFTTPNYFSSIARVTDLLTEDKQTRLKNNVQSHLTSMYHNIDTSIIDSIVSNEKNTGLLTDAQKVKLIALKSELSYYLGEKVDVGIIGDLLYSINGDEKTALLTLKDNVSELGIDTSIIDEVVQADDTNPLTDDEKNALLAMKAESLLYASQIPGVTGVYTQHSEKKGVEGLADTVDMGDDTAWQNGDKDDMYPALKVFYDEDTINNNFGVAHYGSNPTDDEKQLINNKLAEKQKIVKQYCVASVSTVLLSHWDSAMNIDTGTLSDETGWVCGLDQNKFTKIEYDAADRWNKDTDGSYWTKEYTNLAAGTYEFKVQQGEAWAYNFGSDAFNGSNCVLTVEQDCDVYINFDYVPYVSVTGADTNFRIWADFYKNGDKIGSQELGKNINDVSQSVFSAVGSFSNWNVESLDYDLYYIGNGQYSNKIKPLELEAGAYEFKIAQNHTWNATSYGISGKSNNMSFTLTKPSGVIIVFNEDTHLTTIESTVDGALKDVKVEDEKVTYPEYALIGSSGMTGYNWFESPQAVLSGEMEETVDRNGIYTKTYTLNSDQFNKVHGYKVIKNGVDTGIRNYYIIIPPADNSADSVTLTFEYDSSTGEIQIIPDNTSFEINRNPTLSFYGVLGGNELTGYNWGKITEGNDKDKFIYLDQTKDEYVYGTYREGLVGGTGKMDLSTDSDGNRIWSKTYQDVPTGEHSFKVAGESMWESSIDYGSNLDGGNYTFILTKQADVTITFNETTKHIEVTTSPENAIYEESYVVCGNSNLTGESKSTTSENNKMTLDNETGLYKKTYEGITSNSTTNYSFKIVRYGSNNTNPYDAFTIYSDDPNDTETYKIEITYNPSSKETLCKVLDSNGNDVTTDVKKPPNIDSYVVAGDKALTGYIWLEPDATADIQEAAVNAGKMQYNKNTGKYEVTFDNVAVSPTAVNLSFKIVANGTWDSGIDYGKPNGDNYVITLQSDTETQCKVTIMFDETAQSIEVTATPNCLSDIDENGFEWFVCGVYNLVSDDIYNTPKTVYDTVRDITAAFSFTSAQSLDWSKATEHNTENNFYNKLNNRSFDDLNTEGGFDIDYHVQGKDITGHFNVPCIELKSEEDSATNTTQYSCSTFMAGKQWVGVSSKQDDIIGSRYLRLIPTAYLEAGMDADVTVLQASSDIDEKYVYNIVSYSNNSDYNSFNIKGEDDTESTFDNTTYFSRYNFGLTASYAITDINGIGYYGNYSQQNVQKYDENESQKRENVLNEFYSGSKNNNLNPSFVMTSAFAQKASYTDEDDDGNPVADSNLKIDEIQDQALIGSSYGTAKTIVKVYKGSSKVFMSNEPTKKEYYDNYLKWTGQKAFDSDDAGTYTVEYFWSLSDGRYLSDTKSVTITTNKYDITKSVNHNYIEKNGNNKELTYTVTYTNKNEGNFKICDILPFDEDVRYDSHSVSGVSSSKMSSSSFKLKSISVDSVYTTDENGEPLTDSEGNTITKPNTDAELKLYYTTDTSVQSYLYTTDESGNKIPQDNVADLVQNNDNTFNDGIDWTQVSDSLSSPIDVSALFITGKQTNAGTTKTTLTYTVEIQNADDYDSYINNVFFSANDTISIQAGLADSPMILGYSQPTKTAVINRSVSGYVWYDLNFDGKYNTSTEPPIQDVKVVLMQMDSEGIYQTTDKSATTDENGYYEFDDLLEGEYKICFQPEYDTESGSYKTIKIRYSVIDSNKQDENISFSSDKLTLSKRLSVYQSENKDNSRNITNPQTKEDGTVDYYYIDESMPNTSTIYNNNNSPRFQGGSVTEGYFSKQFQNMALKPVITNEACSLTVKKIDTETKDTLANVKFKLEYQSSSSEEQEEEQYQQIYVEKIMDTDNTTVKEYKFVQQTTDDEGNPVYKYAYDTGTPVNDNIISADSIETNSDGIIKFTGLPSNALYRLSEVGTLNGYNMLPNGVEFTLPYYIGTSLGEGETTKTSDDGYVQASGEMENAKGYYKDITYTITNSKIPNMPLTGVENNFSPIVIAFVLLSIGIAVFIAYKIYKAKKSA